MEFLIFTLYFLVSGIRLVNKVSTNRFRSNSALCRLVFSTATCLKLLTRSAVRRKLFSIRRDTSSKFPINLSIWSLVSVPACNDALISLMEGPSIEEEVTATPNGVFISWAIPATKDPNEAIFSDSINWPCADFNWVIDSFRSALLSSRSISLPFLNATSSWSSAVLTLTVFSNVFLLLLRMLAIRLKLLANCTLSSKPFTSAFTVKLPCAMALLTFTNSINGCDIFRPK